MSLAPDTIHSQRRRTVAEIMLATTMLPSKGTVGGMRSVRNQKRSRERGVFASLPPFVRNAMEKEVFYFFIYYVAANARARASNRQQRKRRQTSNASDIFVQLMKLRRTA